MKTIRIPEGYEDETGFHETGFHERPEIYPHPIGSLRDLGTARRWALDAILWATVLAVLALYLILAS